MQIGRKRTLSSTAWLFVLQVPPVNRRHRQRRKVDSVDATDVQGDDLGSIGLASAGEHVDAAIGAKLVTDRVLVEQIFPQVADMTWTPTPVDGGGISMWG